ncbi:uncharacterized protein V6R79_014894 [Siganus canaliculatus]
MVEAAAGMCSVVAHTRRAELNCSVLEEDWQRGQSYMAQWHSLALIPQHHHRPILIEAERSAKHGEARRLLQKFLSWAISNNHPLPKTCSSRQPHRPVADPSASEVKSHQGPVHALEKVSGVTTGPKRTVFETREKAKTKMPRFQA